MILPRHVGGGVGAADGGGARRLVVKVGSAMVADHGRPRAAWLATLAADIADLRRAGTEIIIVSSGAIALARADQPKPRRLDDKQAAAAIGQPALIAAWSAALAAHGLVAAQLLLTLEDTEDRRRYLNARATLAALRRLGAVPVINENDSVATTEIRFGDNDRLAARVAVMAEADTLVLLSDIDGLYTADPRRDPAASHIPVVETITPAIEAMGGDPPPGHSSGGMRTKLAAARIATAAGCAMAIAPGAADHPLRALAEGGRHTLFIAAPDGRAARKRWIAHTLAPRGTLRVDAGAAAALRAGSSLLPAGLTAVAGRFALGDAVVVAGPDGVELARGLAAYDSADAARLVGRRSDEIESVLGWRARDEIVHRDDLVLTVGERAAGTGPIAGKW